MERANDRIRNSVEEEFKSTVRGYASGVAESTSVRLKNGEAKCALYPVWVLNTTWNGEKYTFAMNGQTGKFVGNLPMDKGIFWRYFSMIGVISAVVIYAIARIIL